MHCFPDMFGLRLRKSMSDEKDVFKRWNQDRRYIFAGLEGIRVGMSRAGVQFTHMYPRWNKLRWSPDVYVLIP